jgi:hypothetical protein
MCMYSYRLFSCIGRTYKYFFFQDDLNISYMRQACQLLLGVWSVCACA